MPKVEQIDIKAIFEKASGHKVENLMITKAYPPIDESSKKQ